MILNQSFADAVLGYAGQQILLCTFPGVPDPCLWVGILAGSTATFTGDICVIPVSGYLQAPSFLAQWVSVHNDHMSIPYRHAPDRTIKYGVYFGSKAVTSQIEALSGTYPSLSLKVEEWLFGTQPLFAD